MTWNKEWAEIELKCRKNHIISVEDNCYHSSIKSVLISSVMSVAMMRMACDRNVKDRQSSTASVFIMKLENQVGEQRQPKHCHHRVLRIPGGYLLRRDAVELT